MVMRKWPLVLLFIRLASVGLVQTSFVADEYWQSLEIGHSLCFGYGYKTWEWQEGIRSYLLPWTIAAVYKLLWMFGLDCRAFLTYSPRVLIALLTWTGDLAVLEVARRQLGRRAAAHAAHCLASSWCLFYCGSRTLANTVEMALLAVALRWYPWQPKDGGAGEYRYLWMGALAAVVRPTSALSWLPLWVADFASSHNRRALLGHSIAAGAAGALTCLAVDSAGHGAPLFTPLRFLRHNVLGGVASHYGTSPWHGHLTASLPTLLGLHAAPALLALRRPARLQTICLAAVLWLVAVYSFLPHKEFRFLLPIWPFCALLAGKGLANLERISERWCHVLAVALLVTNVPVALYLGLVHQRGPLDMTGRLAARLERGPLHRAALLYLMPCHSTPLYSHLHLNVSARFLTCEPNLAAVENYTDEADVFYQNPERWLRQEYPGLLTPEVAEGSRGSRTQSAGSDRHLPSHLVMFDSLWDELSPRLSGYAVCESVFHAHVQDEKRSRRIVVLCREGWEGG